MSREQRVVSLPSALCLLLSAQRQRQRLQRRRGAAENEGGTGLLGIVHSDAAGVVVGRVTLFVGRVMLFVQHDQAQLGNRRKQARTGPHDHRQLTRTNAPPCVGPFTRFELAMNERDLAGKALQKAARRLRGQTDLRHQHNRAAALRQHRVHRPHINLGLAAAGHAAQEEVGGVGRTQRAEGSGLIATFLPLRGLSALCPQLSADGFPRPLLVFGQWWRGFDHVIDIGEWVAPALGVAKQHIVFVS